MILVLFFLSLGLSNSISEGVISKQSISNPPEVNGLEVGNLKVRILDIDLDEIKKDEEYLKIMIKSEIAGNKWGGDELWGVRIATDSQIMGALNHFNEADAFLVQSN